MSKLLLPSPRLVDCSIKRPCVKGSLRLLTQPMTKGLSLCILVTNGEGGMMVVGWPWTLTLAVLVIIIAGYQDEIEESRK